jgi:hypothetical protein
MKRICSRKDLIDIKNDKNGNIMHRGFKYLLRKMDSQHFRDLHATDANRIKLLCVCVCVWGGWLRHANIKSHLHLKLVWAQMKHHRSINDKDFKTKEI